MKKKKGLHVHIFKGKTRNVRRRCRHCRVAAPSVRMHVCIVYVEMIYDDQMKND